MVGGDVGGGGGAGTGVVGISHGAGGVLSPARKANVPCRAGVPPSQCCPNEIEAVLSVPLAVNGAGLTVNEPVKVWQPRPIPGPSSPGTLPLNGCRGACAPDSLR